MKTQLLFTSAALLASSAAAFSAIPSIKDTKVLRTNGEGTPFNSKAFVPIPDPAGDKIDLPTPPVRKFKWMPVRWCLKTLQCQVFGYASFGLLLVANFVASFFYLFLKPWLNRVTMRRFGGYMMPYKLTPWIEIKFAILRITTYMPWLVGSMDRWFQINRGMRTLDELDGPLRIPSDDQFISHVMLRSPLAWYMDNTADELVVDISRIDSIQLYPGTYLDVNKVVVDKKTNEITLFSKEMGPITRRTHGDELFDKAMVHTMNSISLWIPNIGHSWVHFCFMDATSAAVKNDIKKDTLLYKLMEPHFLHTSRINWEALGPRGPIVFGDSAIVRMANEASYNTPQGVPGNFWTHLFEPWTPFPMAPGEFVRNNSNRTTEYYFYGEEEEFACPPKWLRDDPSGKTKNTDIPYIAGIKRFYPIVREHVAKVLAHEKPEVIQKFIEDVTKTSAVDGTSLKLERFDPIDVIASMIYNAVFVHALDHFHAYKILREARWGLLPLRFPLSAKWFPGKNVPADMTSPTDQVKWLNFLDVFVQWNDHSSIPLLSNCMKYLKYGFPSRYNKRDTSNIRQADKDFVKAIEDEIKFMEGESPAGVYTPMEKLSRSICW